MCHFLCFAIISDYSWRIIKINLLVFFFMVRKKLVSRVITMTKSACSNRPLQIWKSGLKNSSGFPISSWNIRRFFSGEERNEIFEHLCYACRLLLLWYKSQEFRSEYLSFTSMYRSYLPYSTKDKTAWRYIENSHGINDQNEENVETRSLCHKQSEKIILLIKNLHIFHFHLFQLFNKI